MTLRATSGADVMMSLGGFRFGLNTAAYQELSRTAEQRWAAQDRFGQMAALQHTGPGPETMTLPGVVYPEFRGGPGQLDRMRELAGRGKPLQLITGTGRVLGRYVIERVEERQSVFAAAGLPRKVEFTLSLRLQDDGSTPGGANSASIAGALSKVQAASSGPFGSLAEARNALSGLGGAIAGAVGAAREALVAAVADLPGGSLIAGRVNATLAGADRLIGAANVLPLSGGSPASARAALGNVQSSAGRLSNLAADTSRVASTQLTGPRAAALQARSAQMASVASNANATAARLQSRFGGG